MLGYRICREEDAGAIKVTNNYLSPNVYIAQCELNEVEADWANRAVEFWKIECTWVWECVSTNDNGVDDCKKSVDILNLQQENVVMDNGKAVGYFVPKAKGVLYFKDFKKMYKTHVYNRINKEWVGGMGDIEEYEQYCLSVDSEKEVDVFAWRGESMVDGVLVIDNVKRIDEYKYAKLDCIKQVVVKKGVTDIDERAFYNCTSIEKVVLPSGLKYIEKEAFAGCKNLREINLPSTIYKIEEDAIDGCVLLEDLKAPSKVEKLGAYVRNQDGDMVIKCYTFGKAKDKDSIKADNNDKVIVPYVCSKEETALVVKTLAKWRQKVSIVIEDKVYSTGEFKSRHEDIKVDYLNPINAIVDNGSVVGYYLYVFYGHDNCFMFDEYKDENSFTFVNKETCTIGAYYYHDPHTLEEKITTYSLLPEAKV